MLRAVLAVAAVASAATPYPKGAYKGQNKFLGQKIGAELTVKNSTHLDINPVSYTHLTLPTTD